MPALTNEVHHDSYSNSASRSHSGLRPCRFEPCHGGWLALFGGWLALLGGWLALFGGWLALFGGWLALFGVGSLVAGPPGEGRGQCDVAGQPGRRDGR